jgi:hypothetical protein
VRTCWIRQFASIDPQVEPVRMSTDEHEHVVDQVHQVILATDGTLLDDRLIRHVYTLRDGLVARMDVPPG